VKVVFDENFHAQGGEVLIKNKDYIIRTNGKS
jgi:hypothetical protein